jgi:hypothetical protein
MQGISLHPSRSAAATSRGQGHQAHHSHVHTNSPNPPGSRWFQFSAPATVTAGQTFSLTVTVRDSFNGVDTGYTGIVSFSDPFDPGATLPSPYAFKASDKGVHTFSGFAFDLAFVHDLTIQDNLGNRSFTSVPVVPAMPETVTVTTLTNIVTGRQMPLFVTLFDQFGNVAWNATDTISFRSSDTSAALPSAYTFTPSDYGSHRFTVTMNTGSGSPQTISVSDTTRPPIQGSAAVNVAAAGPVQRYIVTVTNLDNECTQSGGSYYTLTCAINDANSNSSSNPNNVELIQFDIPGCTGSCLLQLEQQLPQITANYLTIDGSSETGGAVGGYAYAAGLTYRPNTNPLHSASGDNANITVQIDGRYAGTTSDGLDVTGNSVVVKGLSITNFGGAGIHLDSSAADANEAMGDSITGNFIGLTPGNGTAGNGTGIAMQNFPGLDTIGGASPTARNIISASLNSGIDEGAYCDPTQACPNVGHNTFQGNYIGLDATGSMQVDGTNLAGNDQAGVTAAAGLYGEQQFDQIGGFAAEAGNIISGNGGWGFEVGAHNTVQGNDVGTDPTGSSDAPNSQVLAATPSSTATALGADAGGGYDYVGGLVPGARNLFTGNPQIQLEDSGGYNVVQGNYVGTNATGTAAVPCSLSAGVCAYAVGPAGIEASGGGDFIGGTATGSGNLLSGITTNESNGYGLWSDGGNDLIQGNKIGTSATGSGAIPNTAAGAYLDGGGDILGGTSAPAGNVIEHNAGWGVTTDVGPNYVEGNTIDANGSYGVNSTAAEDMIGGPTASAGNEIGSNGDGILFTGGLSFAQNNLIGISRTAASIPNADGIDVQTSPGVVVASNTIANNTGAGVLVGSSPPDTNVTALIDPNSIYANGGLGIDLAPAGAVNCTNSPPGPNNYEQCPVITTAQGSIAGTAPKGSLVEVFIATNEADDQHHGEGKTYLGTASADPGTGAWSLAQPFAASISDGQPVTATATQPETASAPAVTSEFAANVTYHNPPPIVLASPPNTFGNYSGVYTSNNSSKGSCPPSCAQTENGSGSSAYIGASAVSVNALADYSKDPTLKCASVTGTMVLTTTSTGDKLNANVSGTTCNGSTSNVHNDSGTFTFTGGTGNYSGAMGGGSYSGQRTCNPSTCAINDPNHRFTLTLSNTSLSVPGH